MKWKNIRFPGRKRQDNGKVTTLPGQSSGGSMSHEALFRQQLKQVSETLGDRWYDRLLKQAFKKKTVYAVLESPHARLTELSGHSVANVIKSGDLYIRPGDGYFKSGDAYFKSGDASTLNTFSASDEIRKLPTWYVDGSSLFMGVHFEDEVYASNVSIEACIDPLIKAIKQGPTGRRLGGVIICLHRHDLMSESTPVWLNKMASFVSEAALNAKEAVPVYCVLEGIGRNQHAGNHPDSFSLLATPVGLFRDDVAVRVEQFSQWFTQARNEVSRRLLRRVLKNVQYVHDLDSRRSAFSELNTIEEGLDQLKLVTEHLNQRWSLAGKSPAPWVRAVFVAPETLVAAPSSNHMVPLPEHSASKVSGIGRTRWWQRFANLLVKDRYCGDKPAKAASKQWQFTAMVTVGGVSLLMLMQLIWKDYSHASQLAGHLSDELMLIQRNRTPVDELDRYDAPLQSLTKIAAIRDTIQSEDDSVTTLTSKVTVNGDRALETVSYNILLTAFGQQLDQQLLHHLQLSNDFETLYAVLKAYLHFHQQRDGRTEYLMWWFGRQWQQDYGDDKERRQQLANYLSAYLEQQRVIHSFNEEQVNIARSKMLSTPLAKRMYIEIKQLANSKHALASDFKEVIGYRQAGIFNEPQSAIHPLFTDNGYRALFLPKLAWVLERASSDQWVLGTVSGQGEVDISALEQEIYSLYISDYLDAWDGFLNQLSIVNSSSFEDLGGILSAAAGSDGAIRRVMQYVYDNTAGYAATQGNISGLVGDVADVAPAKVAGILQRSQQGIQQGVDGSKQFLSATGLTAGHPMRRVAEHFERLNSVIRNSEGKSPAMDEIDVQLFQLGSYVSEFDLTTNDNGGRTSVFDATVKRVSGAQKDPVSQLKKTSKMMPPPLNRWGESLSTQTWSQMLNTTRQHIERAYSRDFYPNYATHLKTKYPLHLAAVEEIEIDYFAEYFKPEGEEQHFFNSYIKPFVRVGSNRWSERKRDGQTLGLTRAYLTQLQRADKVREILFNNRSEIFAELQLQPIYLDANVSRFDLDMMGERISYRHGPPKITKVTWPANINDAHIAMRFEAYNGQLVTHDITGQWALFRLIDAYGKEPMPGGLRYRMSFEIDGQRAVYEASGRSLTPELLGLLGKYRLPEKPMG